MYTIYAEDYYGTMCKWEETFKTEEEASTKMMELALNRYIQLSDDNTTPSSAILMANEKLHPYRDYTLIISKEYDDGSWLMLVAFKIVKMGVLTWA